ncbi:hypothetical protein CsSME_00020659 [Camellia sinensis var. sinensis]
MDSLICPNSAELVIHQDNWPVVLLVFRPVDQHSSTLTSGSTATYPFAGSLLLLIIYCVHFI